jgi:diguanylate cyclase (GGDEF)-like protein
MNDTHASCPSDRPLVRLALPQRWPWAPAALGILTVTGIAVVDWATGPTLSVSLLYALAVIAVTWCGPLRYGVLVAALASAESIGAHVMGTDPSDTLPVAVWNAGARLVVLMIIVGLLGGLRRALVLQRYHATTDPLTGALNRRAFQLTADRECLRAHREGTAISVAYLDLDDFKSVNDRFGHRVGDELLQSFAARVQESIRGTDVFCRIGGDEFVLLFPDTDAREAVAVTRRVRATLAEQPLDPAVTASAGIATFRAAPTTADELVDAADELMYRAKMLGRDTIVGAVVAGPWPAWHPRNARVAPPDVGELVGAAGD